MLDRIAAKTTYDPDTGCLIFTGCRHAKGYGQVQVGSRMGDTRRCRLVHRVAYEMLVGPVPGGLVLDHFRCDNPPCWNITHLRVATHRENLLRGNGPTARNAAKTHCKRGHSLADAYVRRDGDRSCRTCRRERGYLRSKR